MDEMTRTAYGMMATLVVAGLVSVAVLIWARARGSWRRWWSGTGRLEAQQTCGRGMDSRTRRRPDVPGAANSFAAARTGAGKENRP